MSRRIRYPPTSDYALIGDCHSTALVSRSGSIDWCCMPRIDSPSVFGRLLDWGRGGHCSITPARRPCEILRTYLDGTLVLQTTFRRAGGEARLIDCFAMRPGGRRHPHRQLLRILEGVRGRLDVDVVVSPRFDYGEVSPWVRRDGACLYCAIGGDSALIISTDVELTRAGRHDLGGRLEVREGERLRFSIQFAHPEDVDPRALEPPGPDEIDRRLDETIDWWRTWSKRGRLEGPLGSAALRSAVVLKALTHAPTGATVAAPTTSLPSTTDGSANWDYRYSWIRDSTFTVRSLAALGHDAEAEGFRRFVERSAAGSAGELQLVYGVGGERRLSESVLTGLEGYRAAGPVRIGNAACEQTQLDIYGEVLELAWQWHRRGHSPDDHYWQFLVELVDAAADRWHKPDRGIWEVRDRARHFVHSKVMCWAALDRGIRLAEECALRAPVRRWTKVRNEIRRAVETKGYDRRRGVFVRTFGSRALDAALLLLPTVGFVAYGDVRMVRTVDAIREELSDGGLLRRFRSRGAEAREEAFLACSFWLAECLARQGRMDAACEVFDRAVSTGNDLGLFSEEFDVRRGTMLGNFPQGLTHLSHIAAAVALTDASSGPGA